MPGMPVRSYAWNDMGMGMPGMGGMGGAMPGMNDPSMMGMGMGPCLECWRRHAGMDMGMGMPEMGGMPGGGMPGMNGHP